MRMSMQERWRRVMGRESEAKQDRGTEWCRLVATCQAACIIAYGQTGSGKTHTMSGRRADPEEVGQDDASIEADEGFGDARPPIAGVRCPGARRLSPCAFLGEVEQEEAGWREAPTHRQFVVKLAPLFGRTWPTMFASRANLPYRRLAPCISARAKPTAHTPSSPRSSPEISFSSPFHMASRVASREEQPARAIFSQRFAWRR